MNEDDYDQQQQQQPQQLDDDNEEQETAVGDNRTRHSGDRNSVEKRNRWLPLEKYNIVNGKRKLSMPFLEDIQNYKDILLIKYLLLEQPFSAKYGHVHAAWKKVVEMCKLEKLPFSNEFVYVHNLNVKTIRGRFNQYLDLVKRHRAENIYQLIQEQGADEYSEFDIINYNNVHELYDKYMAFLEEDAKSEGAFKQSTIATRDNRDTRKRESTGSHAFTSDDEDILRRHRAMLAKKKQAAAASEESEVDDVDDDENTDIDDDNYLLKRQKKKLKKSQFDLPDNNNNNNTNPNHYLTTEQIQMKEERKLLREQRLMLQQKNKEKTLEIQERLLVMVDKQMESQRKNNKAQRLVLLQIVKKMNQE